MHPRILKSFAKLAKFTVLSNNVIYIDIYNILSWLISSCFMSDFDRLFTFQWERDVLGKNPAVHTVRLYRFWIKQHLSNNNKENTMQTSHLFSHLFVSVKLFQVMQYRFISLPAMHVEKTFDRKFSLNLPLASWRRKEQTEAPCTIPLCVAFMSEIVVCYFTRVVIYLGMTDILRVKLNSLDQGFSNICSATPFQNGFSVRPFMDNLDQRPLNLHKLTNPYGVFQAFAETHFCPIRQKVKMGYRNEMTFVEPLKRLRRTHVKNHWPR